jgi:hypothetical protein
MNGKSELRFWVNIFVSIALASAATGADPRKDNDDTKLDIISKYLDATQTQQQALRGAHMDVDINAKLPKLEKQGKLRALRTISKLGQITYKALGFSGDNTIKKEVIARWLALESEGRDSGSIAITPDNYKFKLKANLEQNGAHIAILQLTPRRKAVGLFRGELWLDTENGMPVREVGRFVKNPSVFLKKIEFVRDYEIRNGIAIPKHIEGKVDTRIVGRAELTIDFSNFTKENADDDVVASIPN